MTLEFGPTSRFYYSQGLRLHYVDWGNPEAPPLLLVHGGRDHCRNWDWVARELSRDYHVIAPDLRGHGDSQWMVGGFAAVGGGAQSTVGSGRRGGWGGVRGSGDQPRIPLVL